MGILILFLVSCHGKNEKKEIVYPEILSLDLYPIEGKAPLKVRFSVTLKNQNLKGYFIGWDFNGDGNFESKTSLKNTSEEWTYNEPGNYVVKVSILNDENRILSTREGLVRVKKNLPPVINSFQVSPSAGRVPLKVILRLDAEDPDPLPGAGGITKTEFDMDGDGKPDIAVNGYEKQAEYMYDDPGIYHVFAYVYDDQNDFAAAGPVTVSVFLPPPVIENPEKQIWHGGGGSSYSVTYATETKELFVGDGYEGLKIYRFSSSYPFTITLTDRELSYLDGQLIQALILHHKVFALFDNSLGVYYSPVSEVEKGNFENLFAGNIPFVKKISCCGRDFIIGENLSSFSLILAEVNDNGVGDAFSYSLEYFIEYLQHNDASPFCITPQARDFIVSGDSLLILMEKCLWELPLNDVITGKYSADSFKFFDLSHFYHSYWKGYLEGNFLFLSHDYGVDLFKYYPGVLTFESGSEPGVSVGPVVSSYFGVYSRSTTSIVLLQSGNEGYNVFYTFSLTSHTLSSSGFLREYSGVIRDFIRLNNSFSILAVGEDGLIFSDGSDYKDFKINDHLKGYGIGVTSGRKFLITTAGVNGYEVVDIDSFTSPRFLYHFSDYSTVYADLYIDGNYGWLVTESSGVAVLNRIRVISEPPYILKQEGFVIADSENGEDYSFYPINETYAVILYRSPSLIYAYIVSGSTRTGCARIDVETNSVTLLDDTLFVSDPAAAIYYYSFPDLLRCKKTWAYKDLLLNGTLITPLVIDGVEWKGDHILLIGGGDRRVYGFNYDSSTNSLFMRDGYPLFGNSEEFSNQIIFKDMKTLGPYVFIAMGNGGFGIIDAYNAGVLTYEEGLITHRILIYPSDSGWVKLILRGNLSLMNNPDYPDTIRFIEIPGLKYSP